MSTAIIAAPTAMALSTGVPPAGPLAASFSFLPTDGACFCPEHASPAQRPKGGLVVHHCGSCSIQLNTNHTHLALCPSCSGARGLCMICGCPAAPPSAGGEGAGAKPGQGCSVVFGGSRANEAVTLAGVPEAFAALAGEGPPAASPSPKPNAVTFEDLREKENRAGVLGFCSRGKMDKYDKLCGAAFLGNCWDLGDDRMELSVQSAARRFRNAEAAFHALRFPGQAGEFEGLSGEEAFHLAEQLQAKQEEDPTCGGFGSRWLGMLAVLRAKFAPGSLCRRALLRTGDAFLLECSGAALGGCANGLGLQLMLVRDEVQQKATSPTWTEYIQTSCGVDPATGGFGSDEVWQAAVRKATSALVSSLARLDKSKTQAVCTPCPAPMGASNAFLFLEKDMACFCPEHDSSDKRQKQEPGWQPCRLCTRQLHSNYSTLALCPDCSSSQGLCMICGVQTLHDSMVSAAGGKAGADEPAVPSAADTPGTTLCGDADIKGEAHACSNGASVDVSSAATAVAPPMPSSRETPADADCGPAAPSAGASLVAFSSTMLNLPGAVMGSPTGLQILPKEAAYFCPRHDSAEKREKGEPSVKACAGCLIQLHTNYTEVTFCPSCSALRGACMICGAAGAAAACPVIEGGSAVADRSSEEVINFTIAPEVATAGAAEALVVPESEPQAQVVVGAKEMAAAVAAADTVLQLPPLHTMAYPEPCSLGGSVMLPAGFSSATIIAMPQSVPPTMLMPPGAGQNSYMFLEKDAARFCADHDTTEKRPKQEPRMFQCRGCTIQLQTNYCSITFCPSCSALFDQCMICGAVLAGCAHGDGGTEDGSEKERGVAAGGGKEAGTPEEEGAHAAEAGACSGSSHAGAICPTELAAAAEAGAPQKPAAAPKAAAGAPTACWEATCLAGAVTSLCGRGRPSIAAASGQQ